MRVRMVLKGVWFGTENGNRIAKMRGGFRYNPYKKKGARHELRGACALKTGKSLVCPKAGLGQKADSATFFTRKSRNTAMRLEWRSSSA
ncbi:hypothetical protein GCM10022293_09310 [Azospirillum formosense]